MPRSLDETTNATVYTPDAGNADYATPLTLSAPRQSAPAYDSEPHWHAAVQRLADQIADLNARLDAIENPPG